jgi:hypothetical protein
MARSLAPTNVFPGGFVCQNSTTATPIPTGVAASGTLTIAGDIHPITPQIHQGLVAGAPGQYDLIQLTLNGTMHGFRCGIADAAPSAGIGVRNAANLGAIDEIEFVIAGGAAAGGEVQTLTINGVPHVYTAVMGDAAANIASGLETEAIGDTKYTTTADGSSIHVKSILRGVGLVVTLATDGVVFTNVASHAVVGTIGQAVWTVTDDGAGQVTATHAVAGHTTDTCVGTAHQVGGTSTFTCPLTATGYDPDICRVRDGFWHAFEHTVVAGDTTDIIADAIAAAINADVAYVAPNPGASIITVTAAVPGAPATFADMSVNNTPGGVALSGTWAAVAAGAEVKSWVSTDAFDCRGLTTAHLACNLISGTSYNVTAWLLDSTTAMWTSIAPVVVNADVVLTVPLAGADHIYVQVHTFVGGGTATIGIQGV